MFNLFGPVDLTEFNRFRSKLDDEGIPYEVGERFDGMQIYIPNASEFTIEHNGSRVISIVCCSTSYGGANGLMEVYAPGLNEGVEGYLDADETYEYVKDTLNGISRGSFS